MPAFVEDRHFDVLASNRLAMALSPRLRPGGNRLRSLLLDPEDTDLAVAQQTVATVVQDAVRRR